MLASAPERPAKAALADSDMCALHYTGSQVLHDCMLVPRSARLCSQICACQLYKLPHACFIIGLLNALAF